MKIISETLLKRTHFSVWNRLNGIFNEMTFFCNKNYNASKNIEQKFIILNSVRIYNRGYSMGNEFLKRFLIHLKASHIIAFPQYLQEYCIRKRIQRRKMYKQILVDAIDSRR